MMIQAKIMKEAQVKFLTEAVSYSENLTIKKGRKITALETWTEKIVLKKTC